MTLKIDIKREGNMENWTKLNVKRQYLKDLGMAISVLIF